MVTSQHDHSLRELPLGKLEGPVMGTTGNFDAYNITDKFSNINEQKITSENGLESQVEAQPFNGYR